MKNGKALNGHKLLSIGYNHYNHNEISIHAEHHALSKLPIPKRITHISLIVIRVLSDGSLAQSNPCCSCINHMINIKYKGYIIDRIYYSDGDGNIIESKLKNLV